MTVCGITPLYLSLQTGAVKYVSTYLTVHQIVGVLVIPPTLKINSNH